MSLDEPEAVPRWCALSLGAGAHRRLASCVAAAIWIAQHSLVHKMILLHTQALVETKGGEVVVGPNGEIAKFSGGGGRAEPPFPPARAKNWWTDNTEWAPEQPPRSDMWWDWRLLTVRLQEP